MEQLIGEGGWAETYRGQDLLLGRPVALKLLRSQFAADPALVDRFEREARIAAAISHPNVVAVYDYGTQYGTFFIALQYIAGEDLKQTVVRRGRLPLAESAGVTREILRGLGAIHRAGIVHRDLKPQNVLLGNDGIVRITDFGIAHHSLATRVTTHGDAMGTASYMAPEQAQGDDVTPETDIYAVGVVLFELLTGRLPFNRGHAMAILLQHIQEMPPSPSSVAPDAGIPAWMDSLVMRAMEKQPADRFSSSTEMIAALDAAGRSPDAPTSVGRPAAAATSDGATTLVTPGASGFGAASVVPPVAPPSVRSGSGSGSPPRTPPPVLPAPRPSRRGRNAVLVLVLLAFLAIAAVVAANVLDGDGSNLFGSGDNDPPTATVRSIPARATATSEATDEPDDEPTERPVPTATTVATDDPSETPELPATETATLEPTDVPTTEPTATTEPETPTPTQTPVPVDEDPPIQQVTEEPEYGAVLPKGGQVVLSADAWSGGAGKKKNDTPRGNGNSNGNGNGNGGGGEDVASVEARAGPKASAAVTFRLNQIPGDGVTIQLETRLEESANGQALLTLAVNDAQVDAPLDITATGVTWGTIEITVPASALQVGDNVIVVTALEGEDASGKKSVILLGDVTVTAASAELGEVDETNAALPVDASETPAPVIEDGEPLESTEPTITPR